MPPSSNRRATNICLRTPGHVGGSLAREGCDGPPSCGGRFRKSISLKLTWSTGAHRATPDHARLANDCSVAESIARVAALRHPAAPDVSGPSDHPRADCVAGVDLQPSYT